MQSLRDFFRSDAFVPSTAVFPPIDADRLAADLALAREGAARGARGQPGPEEDGFDLVESRILERVGDLRRKGLDAYAENVRVYDARLNRAADARETVEIAASRARGDFQAQVAVWQARMATPSARVRDAILDLRAFRRRHEVAHVARQPNWAQWILLALVVVLVESGVNALLFAKVMSQGFAGGLALAVIISAANAAIATLTTYFSRNLNHRAWLWKAVGLLAFLIGAGVCLGFNLGVAHLRDALEQGRTFEVALADSWATLWAEPLALDSFLSAVLMLLGLLAAIIVGLKTYHTIDPYPGYPAVYDAVIRAREDYASHLADAIAMLEDYRDVAIGSLRDANQDMRLWIREAVDALFGQSSLRSELDRFVEHADAKTNVLLAVYRDANRAARDGSVRVPPHFDQAYAFPALMLPRPAEESREEAARQQRRVGELVSTAIGDIERAFRESVEAYPPIQQLEAALAAEGAAAPRARRAPDPDPDPDPDFERPEAGVAR